MTRAGERSWRTLLREMKPQAAQQATLGDHERVDVSIRGLAIFVFGLIVVAVVIHLAIWAMLKTLQNRAGHPEPYSRPTVRVTAKAPYPLLQVDPARDLDQFRVREEAALNSYGWIDRTSGIVRIPIKRAMELLVQRGLPPTAAPKSPLDLQQERAQPEGKQP